jgi:membrane fusion protein
MREEPARDTPLFRPEAVAEQQDRWLGTVLVAPPVPHTILVALVALALAGVLAVLAFGEYTRKARLGGSLAPEHGLIRIVAPQPGVLTRMHADEGLEVAAGAPLAVLSPEAQPEIVITAPRDGTATALAATPGSSVAAGTPLLTLVPAGGRLQARLYAPGRAIGSVRPGQRVLLRYEAFPYQRFGQHEGVVRSVSQATVDPAELAGAAPPGVAPGEPSYRIVVDLASQSDRTGDMQLRPGMQLEADILIETRRLYQWVLDPPRALAGGTEA